MLLCDVLLCEVLLYDVLLCEVLFSDVLVCEVQLWMLELIPCLGLVNIPVLLFFLAENY